MEISAVYHKSGSNFVYAYDKDTVHVKLQTKMNDVQKVILVYGDPYDYREYREDGKEAVWVWHFEELDMKKTGSDGIHDFWFAELKPKWRRLRYAFKLESDNIWYLYGERHTGRITENDSKLHRPMNFFSFPYINPVDVYQAPEWVKDTIWYQIFPERFANGNRDNDPENTKSWDEPLTSPTDFYGGDLQGIIDHLDYLKELGINGIYLTPIFKSKSNHKYDTVDYMSIDPHFGDEETLKELVKKAHALGIRVMLDIVFNHSGFYFDKFQDVVKNGRSSPYKDWFHIRDYPVYDINQKLVSSRQLKFDTFAYTPSMPKLNTENPDTKEYLLNVIRHWSDVAPIDGWRLDVANEVDHQFWREFRKVAREKNPDVYIVGEVWHDATPWLMGDQFDGVMNYNLYHAMTDYFVLNQLNSEEFAWEIQRLCFQYPTHVSRHMYNLIDSHDTPRFLYQTGGKKELLILAYVFLMTYTGAPSIYYGDEVGMTGGQDPDCRRPMIWDEKKQDTELLNFMKKLIRLRKEHRILRNDGDIRFLPSDNPDLLLYQRFAEDEVYTVIMNRSKDRQWLNLPKDLANKTYYDLWHEEEVALSEKTELMPYGFYIFK